MDKVPSSDAGARRSTQPLGGAMRQAIFALALVICGALGLAPVARSEVPLGLLTLDFQKSFPWVFWASTEGRDSEFPDGFRYKLLSARNADGTEVEFLLVRELRDGSKTVVLHAKGPLAKFDAFSKMVIETYKADFGIQFQEYSFRGVQTAAEFEAKARTLGWGLGPSGGN